MQDGKAASYFNFLSEKCKTRLFKHFFWLNTGSNDEFEDIFQLLSPMDLNNIKVFGAKILIRFHRIHRIRG